MWRLRRVASPISFSHFDALSCPGGFFLHCRNPLRVQKHIYPSSRIASPCQAVLFLPTFISYLLCPLSSLIPTTMCLDEMIVDLLYRPLGIFLLVSRPPIILLRNMINAFHSQLSYRILLHLPIISQDGLQLPLRHVLPCNA